MTSPLAPTLEDRCEDRWAMRGKHLAEGRVANPSLLTWLVSIIKGISQPQTAAPDPLSPSPPGTHPFPWQDNVNLEGMFWNSKSGGFHMAAWVPWGALGTILGREVGL